MSTSILLLLAAFFIGGFCGMLLIALAGVSQDNRKRRRTLNHNGVHPLDVPTQ